jgi:oxygen-independent coproporphyrinogen-3 oxidase
MGPRGHARYARAVSDDLGVYVHVPFCTERCAYCDFAIVAGRDERVPEYLELITEEIEREAARAHGARIATVHLGGGTPSKLGGEAVARILRAIDALGPVDSGAEIGLEANPEDVGAARVAEWIDAGVTRLTVGVQALADDGLLAIGRPGAVGDGPRALEAARAGGVASVGADVIFGRPGQTLAQWERELDRVAALDVDHLSLYALETDGRPPLVRAMERGEVARPDPDLAAEMYALAAEKLAASGLARYEVSNFARPGHESRHNLRYWTDRPYLGFGPSAASYAGGERWSAPRRYGEWARRVREGDPTRVDVDPFDPDRRAGEALVFGLRLSRGVDERDVAARYGAEALARRREVLDREIAAGRLVRGADDGRLRLAPAAFIVADEVFVDLL